MITEGSVIGPDKLNYTCKIKGEIINLNEYFFKPNCFKLTNIKILSKQNKIYDFTGVTRYHDICFKTYFNGGEGISNVMDISQFIPEQVFGKTYYFKVEEKTNGSINMGTGTIIDNEIPIDLPGVMIVPSIILGYYTEEPSDFKNLPECYGYKLNTEKTKETVKIKPDKNNNTNIDSICILFFGALLLSIVLFFIYRNLKIKK